MQNDKDAIMTGMNHGQTRTGFASARLGQGCASMGAIRFSMQNLLWSGAVLLCLAFCLFATKAFSADYDNNIIYRNGEPLKIQSKIDVRVELLGNDADFEVVDMVGNGETAFKVNRVADGLKTLEVGGESVSNLVVNIAEDVCSRRCGGDANARLSALESEVARLSSEITNLLNVVVLLQNRVNAVPNVSHVEARQRYPWNGLVDVTFTITETDVAGGGN